jgi:NhaP-type Na+/H+ or K+/H+ antiporter
LLAAQSSVNDPSAFFFFALGCATISAAVDRHDDGSSFRVYTLSAAMLYLGVVYMGSLGLGLLRLDALEKQGSERLTEIAALTPCLPPV